VVSGVVRTDGRSAARSLDALIRWSRMPLSDTAIRAATPRAVQFKLSDTGGLFMIVTPAGGRLWRFKYRFQGKEQQLTIGRYPAVSLKEARARRDAAREVLASGKHPGVEKRRQAAAVALAARNTFKTVALELIEKWRLEGRADATLKKATWFLSILGPALGRRPITEIEAYELLAMLKKVERGRRYETARRVLAFASRVFRYAIATARARANPAIDLRGALISPRVRHHAAIVEPSALGGLLRAIEGFQGRLTTKLALRLAPHVFVRPGELRQAAWSEFNFQDAVWRIPATRMKMDREHIVPLSRQAIAILTEAKELNGRGAYVFPSVRSSKRPMSDATINAALRRMGFTSEQMTGHGFRSTASTLLNESGKWSPDAIERALAHEDTNQVRAAYHRGTHWPERVRMAQWWSDYLDTLKTGTGVTLTQLQAPLWRPDASRATLQAGSEIEEAHLLSMASDRRAAEEIRILVQQVRAARGAVANQPSPDALSPADGVALWSEWALGVAERLDPVQRLQIDGSGQAMFGDLKD